MVKNFNACLLEIERLENYLLLDLFAASRNSYYVYFQVEDGFFFFLFNDRKEELDEVLLDKLCILEHLQNKGEKKMRSLRGFFEKILLLMNDEVSRLVILKTNLHPLFWGEIQDVFRAKRKNGVAEYVFPKKTRTAGPRKPPTWKSSK
jgi:hypothetical protein